MYFTEKNYLVASEGGGGVLHWNIHFFKQGMPNNVFAEW